MLKRRPAVAGYFYPSDARELSEEVEEYMPHENKVDAIGAISPHAGYVYSGHVAGAVYSRLKPKDVFVMLGPNHTGYGSDVSVMTEGQWDIPLGSMSINEKLAKKIVGKTSLASDDIQAHIYEHSLEVQLPFIYKVNPQAQIVPITLKMLSLKDCEDLAEAIAEALKELELREHVIIIASTDMSHYLPDDMARKVDSLAIEMIKNFDPEGLYNTVLQQRISMCGFVPTVTMLYATKLLGAKDVRVIKYATSAEISRDYDKVVGYLGAIII
uniref:MEMO1 family protein ENV75_03480 n=1 Tax=Thermodesulfovibrio aggregans TaxID=86166 RepID=A0A7C4EKD9_9BACT